MSEQSEDRPTLQVEDLSVGVTSHSSSKKKNALTMSSKELDKPGRITKTEQDLKDLNSMFEKNRQTIITQLKDMNQDISKMMFSILVLGVLLFGVKFTTILELIKTGEYYNFKEYLEFLIAIFMSYFGVKSTFKYTKGEESKENTQKKDNLLDLLDDLKDKFDLSMQENKPRSNK